MVIIMKKKINDESCYSHVFFRKLSILANCVNLVILSNLAILVILVDLRCNCNSDESGHFGDSGEPGNSGEVGDSSQYG